MMTIRHVEVTVIIGGFGHGRNFSATFKKYSHRRKPSQARPFWRLSGISIYCIQKKIKILIDKINDPDASIRLWESIDDVLQIRYVLIRDCKSSKVPTT